MNGDHPPSCPLYYTPIDYPKGGHPSCNCVGIDKLHTMPLPDELPFRPYWYAPHKGPNAPHGYGRHRGDYQFAEPKSKIPKIISLSDPVPYGKHEIHLTPYIEMTKPIGLVLPNAITFGFSETGEFADLKGDDRIVSTRRKSSDSWTLTADGIGYEAWVILTGGQWEQKTEDSQGQRARRWLRKCGTALMSYISLGWSIPKKKTVPISNREP